MVYRGKPSKGCGTCRRRKIRCDQRPGSCLNCETSKASCEGYRNQLDLYFLDETDTVRQRNSGAASSSSGTDRVTSASNHSDQGSTLDVAALTPSSQRNLKISDFSPFSAPDLRPSREDLALGFFHSKFIASSGGSYVPAAYDFSEIDAPLLAAEKTLGLMGLGKVSHTPSLVDQASKQYLNAIQHMNTALSFPDIAKRDSTLLAILLLHHYELLAGNSQQALQAWKNHILGAAALLKYRGEEQLKTPYGLQLFFLTVSALNTASCRYGIIISDDIMQLVHQMRNYLDENDSKTKHFFAHWQCGIQFTRFYAKIRSGGVTDPSQMLEEARCLDDEYNHLMMSIPSHCAYWTKQSTLDHPLILGDTYHVYPNFWAAQMWNSKRALRIMLGGIIRYALQQCLDRGLGSAKDILQELESVGQRDKRFIQDTLDSVPQHIGVHTNTYLAPLLTLGEDHFDYKLLWSNFNDPNTQYLPNQRVIADHASAALPRIFGGSLIVYAIDIAARSDLATPKMRQYTIKSLGVIGAEYGIGLASVLAEDLKRDKFPSPWFWSYSQDDMPMG